jgi:tetratricopeptide (TPR) repeat protein
MAGNRIGSKVESLIAKSDWKRARAAIEKYLTKEPNDHWLWARLSGVKYEQRDYQGALEAAEKALEIVPDCPLAIWSKAGALEMLGKPEVGMYAVLFERGRNQLTNPDEDANECWEGSDWTFGLMADCVFRVAGWLAKLDRRDDAVEAYRDFLWILDLGAQGIYAREEALDRLKKLVPTKKAKHAAAVRDISSLSFSLPVPS